MKAELVESIDKLATQESVRLVRRRPMLEPHARDAYQEAWVYGLEAAAKYDESAGALFTTFARRIVRLRLRGWAAQVLSAPKISRHRPVPVPSYSLEPSAFVGEPAGEGEGTHTARSMGAHASHKLIDRVTPEVIVERREVARVLVVALGREIVVGPRGLGVALELAYDRVRELRHYRHDPRLIAAYEGLA